MPPMTTTEEPVDPAEQDTNGTPAQTVRVPNVSPNAKSGLDHTIIGSNALADAGDQDTAADPFDHPGDDSMPQGDQDAALAWVRDAEDSDTAKSRADAVWAAYKDDGEEGPHNADLAGALREATGIANPGTVEETAETPGPAENADTGETTAPGDPLPPADPNATDADES